MTTLALTVIALAAAAHIAVAIYVWRHRGRPMTEPAEWRLETHAPRNTVILADFITKDDKA